MCDADSRNFQDFVGYFFRSLNKVGSQPELPAQENPLFCKGLPRSATWCKFRRQPVQNPVQLTAKTPQSPPSWPTRWHGHLLTDNSGPARGGPHHVDHLLVNPAIAEGQVIAGLDTADVINQVTGQLGPVPLGGVVLVG